MKEIVIKIPEKLYEECKHLGDKNDTLFEAIRRGVILPKCHGRLIDADAVKSKLMLYRDKWDTECLVPTNDNLYEIGRYESYDFAVDEVDEAPTIIAADKEAAE